MVFFSPFKKQQRPVTPWVLILGAIVLLVAFGLRIFDAVRPNHATPTSDVPAISYQDVIEAQQPEPDVTPIPVPVVKPTPSPTPVEPKEEPLKAEFNLAVPFTSQAPTGNWDPLHEDACEEASIYMVEQFYAGAPAGKIDPKLADPELQRLVHFGESMGQGLSVTLAELQALLLKDSGTVSHIVDNPTVDEIKMLIAAGKPVIVPAAGRELGNPNFTGAGPLYHMFVIRGYTADSFIANDPGTRLGENYTYSIEVVMEALGDWNSGDPTTGAKRILYIDP